MVAARGVRVSELLQILANALLELVWPMYASIIRRMLAPFSIADLVEEFFDFFWGAALASWDGVLFMRLGP